MATSLVGNVIDYGFGRNRERGILSQEFAVSTAVDTALAVGTGLAAAGLVALLPVTLPVAGAIGLAALFGVGIGFALDSLGISQGAKDLLNTGIDALEPVAVAVGERVGSGLQAWSGIADNARIILGAVGDRAREEFQQAAQGAVEGARLALATVTDAVNEAARTVRDRATAAVETAREVVAGAASTVRDLLGNLFGGG